MKSKEGSGEFPFPITTGANEPKYLTWIRNHSNYMVARGFLDYFRAAAVLLRGVLGNFVVVMPYLLVIALGVAAANFFEKPAPYIFTKVLLALFVVWILLFLVLLPVFRIARYHRSMATGSDSSVAQRDFYERSFGGFLLAILAVAGLETLPGLLNTFHVRILEADFGWPAVASAIAAATAVFSIVPRLLSILGKSIVQKIALVAVGVLGFLPPLLFVLFVAEFIVFSPPRDWTEPLELAGWVFPAGIFAAVVLGVLLRAFKLKKDALAIVMLLIGALALFGLGKYADDRVVTCCLGDQNELHLNQALVELKKRPAELSDLVDDVTKHPGKILTEIGDWLDNNRAHVAMKRDFFSQPPPIQLNDDKLQIDDAYLEYRAKKRAFYYLEEDARPDDEALLAELLQELLDALRNASHNIDGLSPITGLVDSIERAGARQAVEQSISRLNELYRLYHQVAALRELLASRSPAEVAAKLNILAFPETDFEQDSLPKPQAEFRSARQSLASWIARLREVQIEIQTEAPYEPSNTFIEQIESLARRPNSKLHALLERREIHQNEVEAWRASLMEEAEERIQPLDALLEELHAIGLADPDLYILVRLSRDIRQYAAKQSDEIDILSRETYELYRRSATLRDLSVANSLEELVTRFISLQKGDVYRISGEDQNDEKTFDYEILSKIDGFSDADDALYFGANNVFELRDEILATAILSRLDSAFSATPIAQRVRENYFWPKFTFVGLLAIQLLVLCWLTVDVNLTSIHGLYRDRLASAFLMGEDTEGRVRVEKDLNLMDICNREAGSIAPYHLINVALNLQGSKAIGLRDRQSDFFVFSKRFTGGRLTGYCRSKNMEKVFPQMDLATAMAISAAAASPNMGRGTSPALVALMTLLNIRLGYWVPNPGQLERWRQRIRGEETATVEGPGGYSFKQVFQEELTDIEARWEQLKANRGETSDKANVRELKDTKERTIGHRLIGIGYSGGGIRSATLNLGITQALHQRGVFDHVDYMSTVSGGGYLGSSISTLMRQGDARTSTPAKIASGNVETQGSVREIFRWRVRPAALLREILSQLDEKRRLVNVSDGGHIENLAGIELLRRRCKYIIIGDGEADPEHHFNGLATLIRTARIDLRTDIEIDAASLRLDDERQCQAHWVIGRIRYPNEEERGYLLYLKSSVTGDEDEVIKQYRNKNPSFPHESTADQFFSEGQFEAYRSLGQHIGEMVLKGSIGNSDMPSEPTQSGEDSAQTKAATSTREEKMSFKQFEQWFADLYEQARQAKKKAHNTDPA